ETSTGAPVSSAALDREATRQALTEWLDDLGGRLRTVRDQLDDQTADVRERLEPFVDQARVDWESLSQAVQRLGEAAGHFWQDAATDARSAGERLEAELRTLGADLRAEAATSGSAYRAAVADLVDASWDQLQRLRGQAGSLAGDARGQLDGALERAEQATGRARDSLEQLRAQASASRDGVRDDARQLLDDVREATRETASRLRGLADRSPGGD
ncbi:MAG: hypothetical protein KDB10_03965, partial [Acidimicrobiales bacterium]|nr:hypothetical protein [Acidimicrobiales bacterium]